MTESNGASSNTTVKISKIPGVRLVQRAVHEDNRGWLSELIRADSDDTPDFGQVYVVHNHSKGVVRAFHKHLRQDEVFFVVHGTIMFVCFEDRDGDGDPDVATFTLSAERPSALFVPRGVQHGSMALTEGATILGYTSEPYNPEDPDELRRPWDVLGEDIWEVGGW